MNTVEIVAVHGVEAGSVADDVVDVYRSVFTRPPFSESENEVGWFAQEFAGDIKLPEFRCHLGRVGAATAGFAYGFRTFDADPWNDWYATVLRVVGSQAADAWIRNQFAFGWLAVRHELQGQGIGAGLYAELLSGVRSGRCWLVTHDFDTRARKMYERRGWTELGRGPLGWGGADRLVLGLEVPITNPSDRPG
jgi:GNAT superfamily N-acetyltransferase